VDGSPRSDEAHQERRLCPTTIYTWRNENVQ